MPSKFNRRRTTPSPKRRTPSRRKHGGGGNRSGSRGGGGGGRSRSPPSSRKQKNTRQDHSESRGKPIVIFSDSQSTIKKDSVFLEAAASVQLVVYRRNKLARLQSTVQLLVHLRSLDLSHNNLVSLPSTEMWSPLTRLEHLDLGDNRISQWENVIALSGLKSLISLVLEGNPLANEEPFKYRHFVVNQVMSLKALDGRCIVDSEVIEGLQLEQHQGQQRMRERKVEPSNVKKSAYEGVSSSNIVAGSILGGKDHGGGDDDTAPGDEVAKPWTSDAMRSDSSHLPLSNYLESNVLTGSGRRGDDDDFQIGDNLEAAGGFGFGQDFVKQTSEVSVLDTTEAPSPLKVRNHGRFMPGSEYGFVGRLSLSPSDSHQYMLQKLGRYLRRIRVNHSRSSALVCIQSFFRGHLARKMVDRQLKCGPIAATKLQAAFRGFLLRQSVEEDLRAILMQSESGKDLLVSEWDRLRIDAATSVQRVFRDWRKEKMKAQIAISASSSRPYSSTSSRALLLSATPNWENPLDNALEHNFRPDSAQDIDRMIKDIPRGTSSRVGSDDALWYDKDGKDDGFFARDSDSDADGFDFASDWPAVAQQAWQPRPITIGVTTRPAKQDLLPLPTAHSSKRASTATVPIRPAERHVRHRRQGGKLSEKDAANDSSSHPEEEVIVVGQATRPSSSGPFSGSGIFRKSQLRDLARATRAESRAISQIREQKLMNDIADKRNRVRFIRDIVPAQRKLAKLMRPDNKVASAMAMAQREAARARRQEEESTLLLSRKQAVADQRLREVEAAKYRKETERYRKIDVARRRSRPSSAASSQPGGAGTRPELAGTSLAARVRRRKRAVQSARRQRKRSHAHAMSFVTANNATSRHIAKGNAMRRKRIERAQVCRRVAQTRHASTQRQDLMTTAANRRKAQQQRKISQSREDYKRMLEWRRDMDVHELEMTRLKKKYDSDLRALVRRVRKGELDQPLWDVDYADMTDFQQRNGLGIMLNPMPPTNSAPRSSFDIRQGPTQRKTVDISSVK